MKILIAVQVLLYLVLTTKACTEFRLTAKDGTVVVGRSMEFIIDLMSNVIVEPKGYAHTATLPDHCAQHQLPLTWENKHSIAYLDGLNLSNVAADGQNEAGLSVGALLLTRFTKYQDVPEERCGSSVSSLEFPLWLLGNFATVQEVREALAKDTFPLVWGRKLKLNDNPQYTFELHYSVTDKHGDGIIFEFTKEGRKVHNNTIGVMTNSPPYDWHMVNIRNYIQLSKFARDPLILGQEKFEALGHGSGLLGMPGDLTPPSRLVRAAAMVHFADPVQTSEEAVNLGFHILNTVDIPYGVLASHDHESMSDYTSWIVVKDLKNKALYFRVYKDLTIRVVHLDKVTSTKKIQLKVAKPIGGFVDVTNELQPSDAHTEL